MQKIKYVIIFTLILALALLYIQIVNYDKITNTLLKESRSSQENKLSLEKTISTLKTQNNEFLSKINILQEKIISLEENLSRSQIKIVDTNYTMQTNDLNLTQELMKKNTPTNPAQSNDSNTTIITPSITIDDENKITGFGVEYTQQF